MLQYFDNLDYDKISDFSTFFLSYHIKVQLPSPHVSKSEQYAVEVTLDQCGDHASHLESVKSIFLHCFSSSQGFLIIQHLRAGPMKATPGKVITKKT